MRVPTAEELPTFGAALAAGEESTGATMTARTRPIAAVLRDTRTRRALPILAVPIGTVDSPVVAGNSE